MKNILFSFSQSVKLQQKKCKEAFMPAKVAEFGI